jgi:glycosyltransferase involved in cell wall biosynthesis
MLKFEAPFFSVIVPVHNRSRLLTETLESIKAQSLGDFEVIVVDDGSTDETADVAREYCASDSRFSFLSQSKSGVSAARNLGMSKATGEWMLFLDSDDLMMPDALETFATWIHSNPEALMVGGHLQHINQNASPIHLPTYDNWNDPQSYGIRVNAYEECIRQYGFIPATYAVKREGVIDRHRFRAEFEPCEDYDFVLCVLRDCILYRDPKLVLRYRWHEGNTKPDRFPPVRLRVAHDNLEKLETIGRNGGGGRTRAEWFHRMADDYYELGEDGQARMYYLKALFSNFRKVVDSKLWRQVLATFIPFRARNRLRRLKGILKRFSGARDVGF